MDGYILGIDGGGTGTKAVLLRGKEICHSLETGTINLNGAPEEVVTENIRTLLRRALSLAGQDGSADGYVRAVGLAGAGVSNPGERMLLASCVREFIPGPDSLVIAGDDESALEGAFSGGDGIVLIAGTGSVCRGKRSMPDGTFRSLRSGGFGHLIDDGGSAYAIGRAILSSVVHSIDGRGPETLLTKLVRSRLDAGDDDLVPAIISHVYRPGAPKSEIAGFAMLLETACAEGDAEALRIADEASEELCGLVRAVYRRLYVPDAGDEAPAETEAAAVALMGSVLTQNLRIRTAVTAKLGRALPCLMVTAPEHDAAYGAALLAGRRAQSGT